MGNGLEQQKKAKEKLLGGAFMSVKVEKIEKNMVEMEIAVTPERFQAAVDQAAKRLAQRVNIPGFRKGKAPRRLVEARLGLETLHHEALDNLLSPAYSEAINESGIFPVDRPEIDVVQMEEGKELIFKAKVMVKPEVELGDYRGLGVEKEAVAVDDNQVDEDLKNKQNQHARVITLEEGTVSANGDTANIDFEGFVDGIAFEGGKAAGYDLTIGSGTFIPGFEEQLTGAEIGQEIDVNVQFPGEYHSEELAGKNAVFKVKINRVKRKELSPLDDEFAKDVSEFATLDELKEDIRQKLIKAAEMRAEKNFRNAVVAKVVDNARVEIPEVMITNRIDYMVEELKHNLSHQGLQLEQYLAYAQTSVEDLRERYRSQAAESIKTELVLEAIAKQEGIQVSEDELNEQLASFAATTDVEQLKKSLAARGELDSYKESLIVDKTADFLVAQNS